MAKIQFENKVALNENANIPDVNKCKATDMNEIKSVVNGNDDLVGDLSMLNTTNKSSIVEAINEVYQNNVYSTDEIVIGKTKDGKNVYRKIIETNSATATQEWKNIIGNIKEIFSFTGNLVVNSSEEKILPFTTSGTDSIWFQINTNTHYFQEAHSNNVYKNKKMKIILEYTKVTN